MSSNSSTHNPHQHLIGAVVTFTNPEVKEELQIDWDTGVIVTAFDTPRGVGIYVANTETGEIAEGVTLDGVKLGPDAIQLLKNTGIMAAAMTNKIGEMLAAGGDVFG